jgi:hypothetical protein
MVTMSIGKDDIEAASLSLCKESAVLSSLKPLFEKADTWPSVPPQDVCTTLIVVDDLICEAKAIIDAA